MPLSEKMPDWKKEKARDLRKNLTDAETKMWACLRSKRLRFRFLRQKPILGYIADFYCHVKSLVIEIDGGYHNHQIEYDKHRDAVLEGHGFHVMHFTNDQVNNELENVVRQILSYLSNSSNLLNNPNYLKFKIDSWQNKIFRKKTSPFETKPARLVKQTKPRHTLGIYLWESMCSFANPQFRKLDFNTITPIEFLREYRKPHKIRRKKYIDYVDTHPEEAYSTAMRVIEYRRQQVNDKTSASGFETK